MNDFQEIIKYSLPATFVALAVIIVIYAFFKDARNRRNDELSAENRKLTLSLRLQAYERIALFLERVKIQQLIIRLSRPGMAALQLQWEMINNVNEEFEHNFSQQIYVSIDLWDMVRIAKESLIQQINTSAKALDLQSTGEELARILLEGDMDQKTDYLQDALVILKKEVRQLF